VSPSHRRAAIPTPWGQYAPHLFFVAPESFENRLCLSVRFGVRLDLDAFAVDLKLDTFGFGVSN